MEDKDKTKEQLSKDLAEKKAEEALRASEERLRMTTSQVPAILWTTDTELKFTSSTGAGLDALGLKTDQVVGMTLFEYLQTDDPENLVIKAYRQAVKGNIANYEFEWEGRFFDCHVKPLQNEEGSIIGTIGFALDITKRKKAEMALQESERKYKDLQDASIDGYAWIDMEGHLIEVNDSYINMMGYSEDELLNLTYNDITPEKWHASEQIILTEQILTRGYSDLYEKELIRKDGTIFPVELRAYLIKDSRGINKGMRAVIRDITDRKKAEKAATTERQRLYSLFDALPAFVYLQAPDYTIKYANRYYKKHFGETSGKLCYESLWGRNDPCEICPTFKVFDTKKPQIWEWDGAPDGQIYEINDYPFTDTDGTQLVLELGINITDRKKAEEEREQLTAELKIKNKELEQLLYATSHDLRSPLVNIDGYSKELDFSLKELMSSIEKMDVPLSIKNKITPIVKEDIPESLEFIQKSISKMDNLLNSLLNLSRLGSTELNIEDINMNGMMSDIMSNHEFSLKEAGVNTEVSELPKCKGDRTQANQLFSNLLDNAIKYLNPEQAGVIKITGNIKGDQSVYCVEDNGIGIAPKYREKIFEIFYQLEPNRVKGEGLGLTIVNKIVDKMKGSIWVESELGKGSKFFVSIPS